jgi:hypothetical protein
MTTMPHNVADLYLAPVALAVDARLTELGALSPEELQSRIGVESDLPDYTVAMREEAILRSVTHLIDLHGWTAEWDSRGVRLAHEPHALVLGIPHNVQAFRSPST